MSQPVDLNTWLSNILLVQIQAISSLQSSLKPPSPEASRNLVLAAEALKNLSEAIAILNDGDVTEVDAESIKQLIERLSLENLLE